MKNCAQTELHQTFRSSVNIIAEIGMLGQLTSIDFEFDVDTTGMLSVEMYIISRHGTTRKYPSSEPKYVILISLVEGFGSPALLVNIV